MSDLFIPAGTPVEVEWLDSERIEVGWAPPDQYLLAAHEPQAYRTCGYWLGLAGDDETHVVVVLSWDDDNGNVSSGMSIPMAAVRTVHRLVEAKA